MNIRLRTWAIAGTRACARSRSGSCAAAGFIFLSLAKKANRPASIEVLTDLGMLTPGATLSEVAKGKPTLLIKRGSAQP